MRLHHATCPLWANPAHRCTCPRPWRIRKGGHSRYPWRIYRYTSVGTYEHVISASRFELAAQFVGALAS